MRPRGAALLIAVMLLFAFAVLGALTAGSISGSGATDTNYQGGSVEALYAAETGMERALKQFASSASTTATACTGLGGTNIPAAQGSTRTFTTTNFTTGFNLATLPFTQCRVRVVSSVPTTNASRTVQAILERNLLGGENWAFNLPLGATTNATDWTATTGPPTPAPRYDYTGGPEAALAGSGTTCTRAAYAVKSRGAGGNAALMSTVLPIVPNFSVTTPQTITVRFNYRAILIGNSGNNNCASNTGVAPPAGAPANPLNVWFSVTDTGANTFTTAGAAVFGAAVTDPGAPLNARTVTSANNCRPTTQIFPGDYAACSSHYAAGTTTTKGSTTVVVSAGTGIIASATLFIYLRTGGGALNDPREAWVDNIEFIANTGKLVAQVGEWRDCAVTACP